MANISFGSYKSSKTAKVDNDFIPIVAIDTSRDLIGCEYKKNAKAGPTTLSQNIDENLRKQELKEFTFKEEYFIVFLTVKKGNSKANDPKGTITIKSSTLKILKTGSNNINNAKHELTLKQNYGSTFAIGVSAKNVKPDVSHLIDFYASDDDYYFYSVENVHCGRISFTYLEPLFPKIRKAYPKDYKEKICSGPWIDQCAIRMSKALMEAGVTITNVVNYTNPTGATYCSHKHVLGAKNLAKHIDTLRFWSKREVYKRGGENARSKVWNRTGILYFEAYENGAGNRNNSNCHIEIWNGTGLVSGYDQQMFDANLIIFYEIY